MHAAPLKAAAKAAVAMVLAVVMLMSGGCSKAPGPATPLSAQSVAATSKPSGQLQEVAPPGAVQQLSDRLNERAPQVVVLSPADDSTLPAGPWTLRLKVEDWPLMPTGGKELGPHVVVQLDDQEPMRVSSGAELSALSMPELQPGSHRLTVYAARPWGEAVKSPGASTQIRLHRVARNASQLPLQGSPQLIATGPNDLQHSEPVLIDWLLIDAPLQHLRDDDAHWRLRVSINGDSFLVDRQTPLWLKGFKRGSNAVQLELLDGRGDPLNPPFNSLVKEVVIDGTPRPIWQNTSLNSSELASLSGEPLPNPEPASKAEPAPEPEVAAPVIEAPAAEAPVEPETAAPTAPAAAEPAQTAQAETTGELKSQLPAPASSPAPTPEPQPTPEPEPAIVKPMQESPATTISPSSKLSGSARDLVNPDGSLVDDKPRGPLAGLKAKLGG